MKALVIDDSRLARNELKRLLRELDMVEIVGEAADATEAMEKIQELEPDLLFLDIQMPGKTGFELLEELEVSPMVIFTTAYDKYAIKAFEYNALDYLQKPIVKERLVAAISKVASRKKELSHKDDNFLKLTDQVFVKDGEKCWFVTLREIEILEVSGNYTTIHFGDSKPMIPRTLNYLESRLDPKNFFRANRQQVINLKWVGRIVPWFSGSIRFFMKNGTEIDVSRRQTQRFKDLMSF